jgi:hypothetical protein
MKREAGTTPPPHPPTPTHTHTPTHPHTHTPTPTHTHTHTQHTTPHTHARAPAPAPGPAHAHTHAHTKAHTHCCSAVTGLSNTCSAKNTIEARTTDYRYAFRLWMQQGAANASTNHTCTRTRTRTHTPTHHTCATRCCTADPGYSRDVPPKASSSSLWAVDRSRGTRLNRTPRVARCTRHAYGCCLSRGMMLHAHAATRCRHRSKNAVAVCNGHAWACV